MRARPAAAEVDGSALRDLLAGAAAEVRLVRVPVHRRPWSPTGITVAAGDAVTWLAWGRSYLIRPLEVGVGPSFGLIGRVRGGLPRVSARDTFTFTAERDGPVEFGARLPGELQQDGSISVDRVPYAVMRGGFTAVVARWPQGTDLARTLGSLAARDRSGLCAVEAARLADPPELPVGWHHHPLIAREDVYRSSPHGISAHCCHSNAIIRREADAALTPGLQLRWSWRADELPSQLPEDPLLTHDYLSVALEFDDGRDLTWQWSCALPNGFAYPCPLEHWRRRETHIVVRSGTRDLGRWVDDERPVLADQRAAVGGESPARVVRAWLLAGSLFQGGTARAEFGRLELADGARVVRVL